MIRATTYLILTGCEGYSVHSLALVADSFHMVSYHKKVFKLQRLISHLFCSLTMSYRYVLDYGLSGSQMIRLDQKSTRTV